ACEVRLPPRPPPFPYTTLFRSGPPAGETATPGAADGTDTEDRARTDDRAGRRHGTAAHTGPDPPGGGRAASGGGRSAPSPHRRGAARRRPVPGVRLPDGPEGLLRAGHHRHPGGGGGSA